MARNLFHARRSKDSARCTPTRSSRALYVPPLRSHAFLRSAPAWERIGGRWFPTFGGVVAIEAGKQLYATNLQVERKRFRRPIVVPFPRPVRPAHSGRVANTKFR